MQIVPPSSPSNHQRLPSSSTRSPHVTSTRSAPTASPPTVTNVLNQSKSTSHMKNTTDPLSELLHRLEAANQRVDTLLDQISSNASKQEEMQRSQRKVPLSFQVEIRRIMLIFFISFQKNHRCRSRHDWRNRRSRTRWTTNRLLKRYPSRSIPRYLREERPCKLWLSTSEILVCRLLSWNRSSAS